MLPTEIRCIWGHKLWTVPAQLYLIVRYLPLIAQSISLYAFFNPTSPAMCTMWFEMAAWSESITVLCAHAILVYRLHALYANRIILYTMVGWTALNASVMIGLDIWTQTRIHTTNQIIPGVALYGCSAANDSPRPDYFFTGWIPVVLAEAYLFALSAWKLRERLRLTSDARISHSLADVLLADSFKYYFAVLAVELFQIFGWTILAWEQFTDPFTAAFWPIAGTRLILNLRDASTQDVHTAATRATTHGFEFAVHTKPQTPQDTESGMTLHSDIDTS
ncbi:hypothetical protein EXIGLDRAFT_139507 [Exidia glandulosa HHB12029]|uniref:Fungal pheromone STE3G-protein-coupled receptor n=1 Tax=Exidia glandulosa HHB12029 TaxID=1314781 RepID=A0A165FYI0_EXIGL|nr:hypothetical protein EXIGLDRAFT_139507 [Exidia glandulosa HHB12029]